MNTMEMTKILAGVCGSLLVLLLVKWGAEAYYHPAEHGEGNPAYVIATDDAPMEDVVVIPFAEVLASADAGAGARVFNKCKGCHKAEEGVNAVGPSLFAVVDRQQGTIADFEYSGVGELSGTWTAENLNTFLTKPSDYAPGTSMSFAGLPKETDRANLIAYLATLN